MAITQEVNSLALTFMEGLSCPRSLTVTILMRYGEWRQLVELSTDPHDFADSEEFFAANAATNFLKKYPFLETGIDLEQAAIEKWHEAEKQCYSTNQRLSVLLDSGPFGGPEDARVMDFVSMVRQEVVKLIGEAPPATLQGRFGPGATMSDKSTHCTVGDKMSSVPTLTHDAWPHLIPWTGTKWANSYYSWSSCDGPVFVKGNTFFTVPKTAKTHRACAKEPSINSFYQAACGRAMRNRMRHSGIDLTNGQSVHKRLACAASIGGLDCTIDLSSASDTVATTLVRLLLPKPWYELLSSLRSPYTLIEGKWVRLEKFSSMGNGFTFELETVVFCAIARAASRRTQTVDRVSVYGDDIIVAKDSFDECIAALKYFGFTPNANKTFATSEFRESCGGDYFRGIAVRPYHLEGFTRAGDPSTKKGPPCEPQHYISILNGIRRLASQERDALGRWSKLRRAWFYCLDNLPSSIRRLRGPEGLGDTVIHDTEERWITRERKQRPCVRYVGVYRPVNHRMVRFEGFAYETQFAVALYLAGSGENARSPSGDLIPRNSVTGYKIGWVAYS